MPFPNVTIPSETIQVLQKELRECLETSSEKYDRVVDHYDNVLRERAADLEDLQAQVSRGNLFIT